MPINFISINKRNISIIYLKLPYFSQYLIELKQLQEYLKNKKNKTQ